MIGPVMRLLHNGASADVIQHWLTEQIQHHFGLVPERRAYDRHAQLTDRRSHERRI